MSELEVVVTCVSPSCDWHVMPPHCTEADPTPLIVRYPTMRYGDVDYVSIPLTPDASACLRSLAEREQRPVSLQAALLVLDGLRRAGLDPDDCE